MQFTALSLTHTSVSSC